VGAFSRDRKSLSPDQYPFYGMYRGVVVSVSDPEKAGRVRVRIYPFYLKVQDEQLPWAVQALPVSSSQDTQILTIGDMVFCFFEAGDPHFPIVFLKTFAKQDGKPTSPQGTFETPSYKEGNTLERVSAGGKEYEEPEFLSSVFGQVSVEDDSPGEVKEKYKNGEVIRFIDKSYIRKRRDGSVIMKHKSLLCFFKEWVGIKADRVAFDVPVNGVQIGSGEQEFVKEEKLGVVVDELLSLVDKAAAGLMGAASSSSLYNTQKAVSLPRINAARAQWKMQKIKAE